MAEATNKRPPLVKVTSPRAIFQYPKLVEVDYGTKEYPNPDGSYNVRFLLDASEPSTQKFIEKLSAHHQEALAKGREEFKGLKAETRKKLKVITEDPFYTEVLDKETEEPTGQLLFKAKMKASGTYQKGPKAGKKWNRSPLIFDAHGNRMIKLPDIWSGTEGKVAFELSPYFIPATGATGIAFKLIGVQIINLVSGGQRSAADLGFEEEEGYSHDDAMFADKDKADDATASDDDGSGEF